MKNEDIAAAVGAGIVVAVIGVLVLVASFGPGVLGDVFGQTGAAWAQALTTSAAILGAVWGVHRSHLLEVERREQEAYESYNQVLIGLALVVVSAETQAAHLGGEEQNRRMLFDVLPDNYPDRANILSGIAGKFRTTLSVVESMSDVLARLQMSRFDRPEALTSYVTVDLFLRTLKPHLECVRKPDFNWVVDAQEVLPIVAHFLPLLRQHTNYLTALLEARGAKVIPAENLPRMFSSNSAAKVSANAPSAAPSSGPTKAV